MPQAPGKRRALSRSQRRPEHGRGWPKGRARRGSKPERVNEGLREYLRREVPPATVWKALQAAMEGQNESARVSASRVLMDALAEPHEGRDRSADIQRQAAEAK